MAESLKSQQLKRASGTRNVQLMLVALGVPRPRVYRPWRRSYSKPLEKKSIWCRPWSELYDLLELARANYRQLIKQAHPDKGGSKNEFIRLNQIWKSTSRLFLKHGIGVALLCAFHASAQPRLSILPPSKFLVENDALIFPVTLTNAGTQPFKPGTLSTRPAPLPVVECSLTEIPSGTVVDISMFEAAVPTEIRPRGAADVTGVLRLRGSTNGTFRIRLIVNGDDKNWIRDQEFGAFAMVRVSGTNATLFKPPRPTLAPPKPPPAILARYKAMVGLLPPAPFAKREALPAASPRKQPLMRGRTPR